MEADLVTAAGEADLTIWGLIWRADPIIKAVMVILVIASLWSWAIIFDKLLTIRRMSARAKDFEGKFWSGGAMDDFYSKIDGYADHPMAAIFIAGMREWRRSKHQGAAAAGLRDRVEQTMSVSYSREMEYLEKRLSFLATVGSVAPFIGLLGTVWGIMNSFQAIATSQNTSLVVVAPGIAEALFATALGLLAAIPAVIFFNKISADIGRYGNRVEMFAGEFLAIVSRQIDRQAA